MAKRARRPRPVRRPHKYELYERAVQDPEADIALVNRLFRKHFGRPPRLLREDFCGTALFAAEWVKHHAENRAWGIDLDPLPLAWGRRRHVAALAPDEAARLKLIEGNVLDVGHEKVDVTVAFNFSYFLFDTRDALRRYFAAARATLGTPGLLLLDVYGGYDALRCVTERRRCHGFTYVWDQHSYDPISHRVRNYIHFDFPDGGRMARAFSYAWRLWTIPEIREMLEEAGFRKTEVYWESTDHRTGRGNGVFRVRESADSDPGWIGYIVALP